MSQQGKGRSLIPLRTLALTLTACLMFTSACTDSGSGDSGDQKNLVVGIDADVFTLDPSADTSPIGKNLFNNVFDQLTKLGEDGQVEPGLATSWESNETGTAWTFKVRDDATFHDGTAVTLDDIVWSYEMIQENSASPLTAYLGMVERVRKSAANEVEFELTKPFASFPNQASLISIIPRQAYEELGPERFAEKPVGSGPYEVVEWVKDDHISLKANKDYWAGSPEIEAVTIRPIPSESSRVVGLETGELNLVPLLPPSSVARLTNSDGIRVRKVPSTRVVYLGFDTSNPNLGEPVRKAVDLAIDREAISSKLLQGLGHPIGQIVAPTTFGFDDTLEPTAFDADQAKSIANESGYDGSQILFQFPNDNIPFAQEVAEAVAGYLKAIGVNVKLQGMAYSAFIPLYREGKLPGMHMFAFGPSTMDAELPLSTLYETGGRGYWHSAAVDTLIAQQRTQVDASTRKSTIAEIWRISRESAPFVMLYNEVQASGTSNDVDWIPRPDGVLDLTEARFAGDGG